MPKPRATADQTSYESHRAVFADVVDVCAVVSVLLVGDRYRSRRGTISWSKCFVWRVLLGLLRRSVVPVFTARASSLLPPPSTTLARRTRVSASECFVSSFWPLLGRNVTRSTSAASFRIVFPCNSGLHQHTLGGSDCLHLKRAYRTVTITSLIADSTCMLTRGRLYGYGFGDRALSSCSFVTWRLRFLVGPKHYDLRVLRGWTVFFYAHRVKFDFAKFNIFLLFAWNSNPRPRSCFLAMALAAHLQLVQHISTFGSY